MSCSVLAAVVKHYRLWNRFIENLVSESSYAWKVQGHPEAKAVAGEDSLSAFRMVPGCGTP